MREYPPPPPPGLFSHLQVPLPSQLTLGIGWGWGWGGWTLAVEICSLNSLSLFKANMTTVKSGSGVFSRV